MPIDREKVSRYHDSYFLLRYPNWKYPNSKYPSDRPAPLKGNELESLHKEIRAAATEDEREGLFLIWKEVLYGVPDWEQDRAVRYLTSHITPQSLKTFHRYMRDGEPDDPEFLETIKIIVYNRLYCGPFEWNSLMMSDLWMPLMRRAAESYTSLTQNGEWEAFLKKARREFPVPLSEYTLRWGDKVRKAFRFLAKFANSPRSAV